MMNFPTRRQFQAWLKRKEPQEIVSVDGWWACDCPLAKFLETKGAPKPYVRPDVKGASASCWRESDGEERSILPRWANKFALEIDNVAHVFGRGMRAVTAAQCIAALEKTLAQ